MTLSHAAESGIFLAQLANAAARGVALAAVAGLGLSLFRVKATSVRLFTWTAVLYAATAIPLLGWILPSFSIPIPASLSRTITRTSDALPSSDAAITHQTELLPSQHKSFIERPDPARVRSIVEGYQPAESRDFRMSWPSIVAAVYFIVALFLLARFTVGLVFTRRLVKAAQEICDLRVAAKISSRSGMSRRRSVPQVRESGAISIPVTVGPIRSKILLPSNWREWNDEKLAAVIAHEMSHITRHDALSHCVALLHRAVFWFSPLAWWLNRHIIELAEQASDEAALSGGVDRTHYARTLLQFFETLHAEPTRIWWQGVSMANAGQAEKRLQKILTWRGTVNMGRKKFAAVVIVAFAIPVVFLAAAARPVPQDQSSGQQSGTQNQVSPAPAGTHLEPPPPSEAPASPSLPPAPEEGVSNSGPEPVGPVAPVMPSAPIGPGPVGGPVGVGPAGPNHRQNGRYWYSYGFDDDQRFVIVTGKSDSFTMSRSSQDAHHVEKLRKQIPGDFIWFQRDEKSYIIRDQATIDRARKLWAPQEELGTKQEELGRQQEVLGKQQEELGAKMEQVKVNVPDMTADLERLKTKLQKLGPSATMEQVGELQSEIGELQSKIGELQSHAGEQQGKLGEEMGALGDKQGKLGEQQGELGRQQAELAEKATQAMKQLLDEAIKNGTAKPEAGETGGASL